MFVHSILAFNDRCCHIFLRLWQSYEINQWIRLLRQYLWSQIEWTIYGFSVIGQGHINGTLSILLDIKEIRETIKICVKECPGIQLKDSKELHKYSLDSQSNFCRYDFDMNLLLNPQKDAKYFNHLGPCPPFPIYESKPVLHRCVPTDKDAPGKSVRELYGLLNSWDATQQLLSDLYTTWPVVLLLVFIALVFSIILIALMHWLTKLVSWLICIFVAIASIALTIILWWTYYSIKQSRTIL